MSKVIYKQRITNKRRPDTQKRTILETRSGGRLDLAETPWRLLRKINEMATRLGLDPLPSPMWFEGAAA
jgi:hypothetical protein